MAKKTVSSGAPAGAVPVDDPTIKLVDPADQTPADQAPDGVDTSEGLDSSFLVRMSRTQLADGSYGPDITEVSKDQGQTWEVVEPPAVDEVVPPLPNASPETTPNATASEVSSAAAPETSTPSATGVVPPAAALKAFAADGTVYAKSTDGGKNWFMTPEGALHDKVANMPQARKFTRRIVAVINEHSPVTDKRITIPFSAMAKADILAGWADFRTIIALDPGALQGIVIPFAMGMEAEHYEALRTVGSVLFLDVPAPMYLAPEGIEALQLALKHVDVVTVPTEILANKFRSMHKAVFAVPDMVDPAIWRHFTRPPKIKIDHPAAHPAFGTYTEVVIGVPPKEVWSEALGHALDWVAENYHDRVRIEQFDWTQCRPADEPALYGQFDVVVVKGPEIKSQISNAPILGPMMAGCGVVADNGFRIIRHRHNGLLVAHDTVHSWRDTLRLMIADSRARLYMGRNAHTDANRQGPDHNFNKLLLPYRLSLPETEPISYKF